jgi:hypothetical protein
VKKLNFAISGTHHVILIEIKYKNVADHFKNGFLFCMVIFFSRDDVPMAAGGNMDVFTALQEVLKTSLINDGLATDGAEKLLTFLEQPSSPVFFYYY